MPYTIEEFFNDLDKFNFIPENSIKIENVLITKLDLSSGSFFQYIIGVTPEMPGSYIMHYQQDLKNKIYNDGKDFPFVNFGFEYDEKEKAITVLQGLSTRFAVQLDADVILSIVKQPHFSTPVSRYHIVVSQIRMKLLQSSKYF